MDGGGLPGIGAIVDHQHVVGGLADAKGEGPGSSSGSEGEDAMGEIVAEVVEIRARHEGKAYLAGARRNIEAGGDQGRLLAEIDLHVLPFTGGYVVDVVHQFDVGSGGKQED